jgi:hypothetical protein
MPAPIQVRVTPTVLSGTLIGFVALWFASAIAFSIANTQSKDGWSAAPVSVMWALFILPLLALVLAACLVSARRTHGQRLRAFDYCAIAAATAPFVVVGGVFLTLVLNR